MTERRGTIEEGKTHQVDAGNLDRSADRYDDRGEEDRGSLHERVLESRAPKI